MPAQIMDGTSVATTLLAETARRAGDFALRTGRQPVLATVLVGDDPASHTYVRMKRARCVRVGIESRRVDLPANTTSDEIASRVRMLSADPSVDGILLQHSLPQPCRRAGRV
ncbi:tetrahydrofolate dehydrogenase/cyclohydrolase catalytic domain-containing protein [Amycolatopsis anabasis]|uniref:tetrahydrofolate dehydrogenase/cyclohydrolase catalytic domain-containing protein n=1 Tax=Amycolatopsis anabasis TaxID=1840409 RepID=UPI0031B5ECE9